MNLSTEKWVFCIPTERFTCNLGPIRRKNLTLEILKNSTQRWVSKKHLPLKVTWVSQCRWPIHSEAETQSFEVQRNVFWVSLEKNCCFPLRFALAEVLLALSVWNQLQNFSPLDPLQHLSPLRVEKKLPVTAQTDKANHEINHVFAIGMG